MFSSEFQALNQNLKDVCKILSWGPEETIDKEHLLARAATTMLINVTKFEEFYNEKK